VVKRECHDPPYTRIVRILSEPELILASRATIKASTPT
jgi:hypothetical protein